ncbi:type II secretion system protein N [Parvularcula maris]|uniref:Type II secretion system protein N n=1 Tax=Parvularcula maris TaxID=2965077 RepID=A0A9X2L8W1_9PROT|nr:type II secretion system protein N [Parvularcula maris]MCQ8185064.1 type II secretion system protein N [Parvularcula maris]
MRKLLPLILLGILVFAAAIVSRLPASLVLDRLPSEVSYNAASGSLWRGELQGVRVSGQSIGRVTYRIKLLPLLTGRAAAFVTADGPSLTGRGDVAYGSDTVTVSDFRGQANLQGLGLTDFFEAPLVGSAEVEVDRIAFGPSGCEQAAFRAETDVLVQSLGVFGGEDLTLSGEGACQGENLVLPLGADSSQGSVDVQLILSPEGQWVSSMTVQPTDPRFGSIFQGAGFRNAEPGTWSIERRGVVGDLL